MFFGVGFLNRYPELYRSFVYLNIVSIRYFMIKNNYPAICIVDTYPYQEKFESA